MCNEGKRGEQCRIHFLPGVSQNVLNMSARDENICVTQERMNDQVIQTFLVGVIHEDKTPTGRVFPHYLGLQVTRS